MNSVTIPPEVTVHKEGEEGTITLDGLRGVITTNIMDRPDWSEGLVYGLLGERRDFYQTRLGGKATEDLLRPSAIAYQDLGWVGLDDEGNETEHAADPEFRMEVLAAHLGIDRENGEVAIPGAVAVELPWASPNYTPDEIKLMDAGMQEMFGQANTAMKERKTA